MPIDPVKFCTDDIKLALEDLRKFDDGQRAAVVAFTLAELVPWVEKLPAHLRPGFDGEPLAAASAPDAGRRSPRPQVPLGGGPARRPSRTERELSIVPLAEPLGGLRLAGVDVD